MGLHQDNLKPRSHDSHNLPGHSYIGFSRLSDLPKYMVRVGPPREGDKFSMLEQVSWTKTVVRPSHNGTCTGAGPELIDKVAG